MDELTRQAAGASAVVAWLFGSAGAADRPMWRYDARPWAQLASQILALTKVSEGYFLVFELRSASFGRRVAQAVRAEDYRPGRGSQDVRPTAGVFCRRPPLWKQGRTVDRRAAAVRFSAVLGQPDRHGGRAGRLAPSLPAVVQRAAERRLFCRRGRVQLPGADGLRPGPHAGGGRPAAKRDEPGRRQSTPPARTPRHGERPCRIDRSDFGPLAGHGDGVAALCIAPHRRRRILVHAVDVGHPLEV